MKAFIVSKNKDDIMINIVKDKLSFYGIGFANSINDCDVVITIGGDGTILRTGKKAAEANKPLLGINTGRLGFMATLEKGELDKLSGLKTGDFFISRRMLLKVEVCLKLKGENKSESFIALNEVVVHRRSSSPLPDFVVSEIGNETEIIRIRGDGIIISTPTGSTAYSLSAGGPIIDPEMECFLLTALSPHSLFNRPMIFSKEKHLCISVDNGDSVFLSVDGEELMLPSDGEIRVVVSKSLQLDLIDIDGDNFYSSIHNKLMRPLK